MQATYKGVTVGVLKYFSALKNEQKGIRAVSALKKPSKRHNARFLPDKKQAKGLMLVFCLKKTSKRLNARFLPYKKRVKGLMLVFCLIKNKQKA